MKRVRVIPLLMLDGGKAVVTRRFKDPVYVGDPINAIKIFNEKEVDELIIVDITKKTKTSKPDFDLIRDMASESFMPLAYGGHVTTVEDAERIIHSGIEKISFNTALFHSPEVVKTIAYRYGSQSVVASLDVTKNFLGKYVVKTSGGKEAVKGTIESILSSVTALGVGEILLTFIDTDGMMTGYNIDLLQTCAKQVNVPIVGCGGAGSLEDLEKAIRLGGASAVAAGAMFYFKGGFNSILINYPDQNTLVQKLYTKLDQY